VTEKNKIKMNDQLHALAALVPGKHLLESLDRRMHRLHKCLGVVMQNKIPGPDRTNSVVNHTTNSTIPVILPYKSFLYLHKVK
jgi:hypothetical protein